MQEWLDALMYGGALAALLLFIWGLMTRKWMMYQDHEAIVKIKDEQISDLKAAIREANATARQAVTVADKVV